MTDIILLVVFCFVAASLHEAGHVVIASLQSNFDRLILREPEGRLKCLKTRTPAVIPKNPKGPMRLNLISGFIFSCLALPYAWWAGINWYLAIGYLLVASSYDFFLFTIHHKLKNYKMVDGIPTAELEIFGRKF